MLSRDAFVRLIGGQPRRPTNPGARMPEYLRAAAEREYGIGPAFPLPVVFVADAQGPAFDPFTPEHRAAMLDREF